MAMNVPRKQLKIERDVLSVIGKDSYNYYRQNRKKTAVGINTYELFTKSVGAIFEELRDMMLESEAGVHLEGFGYFCFLMNPVKTRQVLPNLNTYKNDFDRIKKRHRYYPYFFGYKTFSKQWTMSLAFNKKFYARMKQLVRAGKKYRMLYSQVMGLQQANRNTRNNKNKK